MLNDGEKRDNTVHKKIIEVPLFKIDRVKHIPLFGPFRVSIHVPQLPWAIQSAYKQHGAPSAGERKLRSSWIAEHRRLCSVEVWQLPC